MDEDTPATVELDDGPFLGPVPGGRTVTETTDSDSVTATDSASETSASDGADTRNPVNEYVRLMQEHAAAAASLSPDQPWLLAARRSAATAINESNQLKMEIAIRHPRYAAGIDIDTAERSGEVNTIRVAELLADLNGPAPLSGQNAVEALFANPVDFYARAKQVYGSLSSSLRGHYDDAADLDIIVKRQARSIASGTIVDLAFQRGITGAQLLLADAGLPRDALNDGQFRARDIVVERYLEADKNAVLALGRSDWTAFGEAERRRQAAMTQMLGDPVALARLGVRAAEVGIDIRGKAAADLAAVHAARDPNYREAFDKRLRHFEASFFKDLTPEGSDPVKRWIKIQNEILSQEKDGRNSGPNLAYLRQLSLKTSGEVAATTSNFVRLGQSRPDLMQKLVLEADRGRESLRSLGKESTVTQEPDGRLSLNEAADLRNKGETDREAAAKAPDAARVDQRTADINARNGASSQAGREKPAASEPTGTKTTLRATEEDRIGPKTLTDKQAKALTHSNSKNPEFDEDKGEFYERKPMREFGKFVNARTPYDVKSLNGQLNDKRKKVFAVPLDSFSSDHRYKIKKTLRKIAKEDPERFKKMYQATKDTWNAWRDNPSDHTKEALDKLELGRRILAEVGVQAKIIPVDKAKTHAKQLLSRTGQELSSKHRWDPGDFMQKRDVKRYGAYLKSVALGRAGAWAKETNKKVLTWGFKETVKKTWAIIKEDVVGIMTHSASELSR